MVKQHGSVPWKRVREAMSNRKQNTFSQPLLFPRFFNVVVVVVVVVVCSGVHVGFSAVQKPQMRT